MKISRFNNIFSIAVLTIIFTFGMVVSVMADDTTEDATVTSLDVVAEEAITTDSTPEESEEAEEDVIEDVDSDDLEDEIVEDVEDIDNVDVDVDVDADDTDDEGIVDVEEEIITEEVIIEPVVENADDVALGDASSYNLETGETTVFHADGSVDAWIEPSEEMPKSYLGTSSSYDPITKTTTVIYPDNTVEIIPDEVEEPTFTSSTYEAPVFEDNDEISYRTASVYNSDTFFPLEVEEGVTEAAEVVEEATIAPVAEEETAVLGDYEEPVSRNIPVTAGLALFSSTIIGFGVLWKLGILAL